VESALLWSDRAKSIAREMAQMQERKSPPRARSEKVMQVSLRFVY
jgi:hypothetical protein